mmetsp:Transcript_28979/g.65665  ORF Transcript_28979/g.65665 Transcript_28979/m.65665 type:complete len:130 (+) Transcript_28979:855-1244(+)
MTETERCWIVREAPLGIHLMTHGDKDGKVFVLILSTVAEISMELGMRENRSKRIFATMASINGTKQKEKGTRWTLLGIGWVQRAFHHDLLLLGGCMKVGPCISQGPFPGGRWKLPNDWMERCLEIRNMI